MTKLLIVCMGNICRSPMAHAVFAKKISNAGLSAQISVDSAGTHAARGGERPDPRADSSLSRRGYAVGRIRSRRIEVEDFQIFDLILAMDSENLADLRKSCPQEFLAKIRLFLDFEEQSGGENVPDPYYGNAQGFERVLDLCEAGVDGWIDRLR